MQDTKFMTAAEKEKVLRDWESFLKSGLKPEKFTQALYHHLEQHCSFIAHYDRGGFYSTYFSSGDGKAQFLRQFDTRNLQPGDYPLSIEYGMSWCYGDYEDINKAMVEVATRYIPTLLREAEAEQRDRDLAVARALLAKHGM